MTFKRVPFKPLGSEMTNYGELVIGQNGTLLYTAIEVQTGKPVTVVLSVTEEDLTLLQAMVIKLNAKYDEYSLRMAKASINHTPADMDFISILNDLKKPGKLH